MTYRNKCRTPKLNTSTALQRFTVVFSLGVCQTNTLETSLEFGRKLTGSLRKNTIIPKCSNVKVILINSHGLAKMEDPSLVTFHFIIS